MISFFEASLRYENITIPFLRFLFSKYAGFTFLWVLAFRTIRLTRKSLIPINWNINTLLFTPTYRDESLRNKEAMDDEICDKLRSMINLTEDFQAPIDGIDGLLGGWETNCSQDLSDMQLLSKFLRFLSYSCHNCNKRTNCIVSRIEPNVIYSVILFLSSLR